MILDLASLGMSQLVTELKKIAWYCMYSHYSQGLSHCVMVPLISGDVCFACLNALKFQDLLRNPWKSNENQGNPIETRWKPGWNPMETRLKCDKYRVFDGFIAHRIHVWYTYLHLGDFEG